MYARRAAAALETLRPAPGDVVEVAAPGGVELREIASIGADGQLYFRSGRGQRARPHAVRMFARLSDAHHKEAAYKAHQQTAAHANSPEQVGPSRVVELTPWKVYGIPSRAAVLALQDALDTATDERPLQKILERYPEILGYLPTGHHGTYVIPQGMLGKEYVPDFLIAAYTSAGLWWTLVELESPAARLTIADGQPSKQLRKAIQQVNDWREWLRDNSDYARRSTNENGLGLPGIRDDARALIIISRDTEAKNPDKMRLRELGERNIEIRTYDWLVRNCQKTRDPLIGILDSEVGHQSRDQNYSFDDLLSNLLFLRRLYSSEECIQDRYDGTPVQAGSVT